MFATTSTSTTQITFDWNCVRQENVSVDLYEETREPRRHNEELFLDWYCRKRLLRCFACVTEAEILETTRDAQRIRKQRVRSRNDGRLRGKVLHFMAHMFHNNNGIAAHHHQGPEQMIVHC